MTSLLNFALVAGALQSLAIGLPACAIVADDFRQKRPDVNVIATTLGMIAMAVVLLLLVEF